jgi:DNA/RNA endonuclease G (NUC1)
MFPPNGRRLSAYPRHRLVALLLIFSILLLALPKQLARVIPSAHAASNSVVISEFRTRGPSGGNDEFVELYNLSGSSVNIGGWKINASNGSGVTGTRVTITAGTTIPSHGHFLAVNNASGGYSGSVTGNQTYSTGITDDGGVALLDTNNAIIDQAGMSAGSAYKETSQLSPQLTTNVDRCFERKPGGASGSTQDTDNNPVDFQLISPCAPQNLASTPTPNGGSTNPTGTGLANPSSVAPTDTTLLTVAVTPGTNPTSTGLAVTGNLSAIGGSATQQFFDDGTHGDVTAGDNTFSFSATVAANTTGGAKTLPASITDAQSRSATVNISLTVLASTSPSGTAAASPNSVLPGDTTTLTVNVTPGANPTSTGLAVTADLSSIGGANPQPFSGSGNTFTFQATVAANTTPGAKTLPVTITDAQNRSGSAAISLTVQQPPQPLDHVVISQVYGGGGNTNATYTNDYVELYNPTSTTFTLTGWSLQYASATGTSWTNTQPLGGTIGPGEYYLVQLASGTNGQPLPVAPNIVGSINMSATTGKIALVSNGDALAGACPNTIDPDIVDFVGYGGSANCREGGASTSANAPAPSNSTAIFRVNGGSTDTNNNSQDFVVGAPSPRRSAPIVELGPWVASTDPTTNDTDIPHDASITVNFSEPVDVDAAWYNINCPGTGGSGLHNDATVAHTSDLKTYVITPNVNFQFGEQCTVTILKNGVHDHDTDDSAADTDTLFADYVWSFTVIAAGNPPPYTPDVHLTMGNPSNAAADINQPNNYLMMKPTYALSYNRDKGTPNWVSWQLDNLWTDGSITRVDTFRPDPAVPPDWYRVQATDFFTTGFDRGHMTPNADRDNPNLIPNNQETFLMTNMVPQAHGNNAGPWEKFEIYLRTLLPDNEIYIVAGPAGVGGTGSNGFRTTVADGHVTVPQYTWKVALVLPKADGDDVARVTAATRTIAVIMPNADAISGDDWTKYLTTVDAVEGLTGLDFYSNVPDAIENSIEAGTNGSNPPGTADGSATTAEDTPVSITLDAASPNNNPLTTTIVSQPTNGSVSCNGTNCTYTPAPNFHGTDSFKFTVSNVTASSNTSTETILVTDVNDSPVALDDSATTDEDTPAQISVLANDSDVDGDAVSITAVTQGAHGSVVNNGDVLTYSPAPDYNGADSFTYTVGDGRGGTATANVSVTINPVNDPPTAAADSVTTDEDTPTSINVLANDGDADSDPLNVTAVTQGAHGSVTNNGDGTVSYSPGPNYNGSDSFSYTVSDGHGGTASAAVIVTINPVNDAPVAANDSATTDEDTTATITVLTNDTDVDGDTVSVTSVGSPAHGTAALNPDGTINYAPAPNYNGSDSFTYTVGDGHGGTASATVSVTINPVNDPPVASDGGATTDEDTSVAITLAAADVEGDALTFSVVSGPAHGSVSISGHTATYTPAPDYNGADSFTFKANDGQLDSNAASVNVQVNPVNDAPVLSGVPASATIPELSQYTFAASAGDVDGDRLTFSLVGAPAGASITPSGQFTWTPTEAQGGTGSPFSFKVRVSDGAADADADVTINVTEVNQPPVLAPIGDKIVLLGDTLTFTASAADADLPSQQLSYSLTGSVPAGASLNASTGQFTWTPAPAQAGQVYAITVRATDDGQGSLSAEQTVHVGVGYTWTGFLAPVNPDGSSIFKLGRTVPMKFALTGASAGVTNAVARLYVAKLTDSILGTEEQTESAAAATAGNLFRYSDGQYVFNLSTDGLTAGTYQLRVDTGDGVVRVVNISLR